MNEFNSPFIFVNRKTFSISAVNENNHRQKSVRIFSSGEQVHDREEQCPLTVDTGLKTAPRMLEIC